MGIDIRCTAFDADGNVVPEIDEWSFNEHNMLFLLGVKISAFACIPTIPHEDVVLSEGLPSSCPFIDSTPSAPGEASSEFIQKCARAVNHLYEDEFPFWISMKSIKDFDWKKKVKFFWEMCTMEDLLTDNVKRTLAKAEAAGVVGFIFRY